MQFPIGRIRCSIDLVPLLPPLLANLGIGHKNRVSPEKSYPWYHITRTCIAKQDQTLGMESTLGLMDHYTIVYALIAWLFFERYGRLLSKWVWYYAEDNRSIKLG